MKVISLLFLLTNCAYDSKHSDPIKGAIKKRNESFRACYHGSEQYRGRFSKPYGEITVRFSLSKEGKVSNEIIVHNTFPKDPNFVACVLEQLRIISFSRQEKEIIVDHKFDFLQVDE
jgi:hypothetical protein